MDPGVSRCYVKVCVQHSLASAKSKKTEVVKIDQGKVGY